MLHYQTQFDKTVKNLPGSKNRELLTLRQEALKTFLSHGFPTTHEEAFKYTNLQPIAKREFIIDETSSYSPDLIFRLPLLPEEEAWQFVFINGRFQKNLSRLNDLPSEITFSSLFDAMQNEDPKIKDFLLSSLPSHYDAFTALNTAFMSDGIYLDIPENGHYTKPFHLVFVASGVTTPFTYHTRNLIVLNAASRAHFIENYVALEENVYLANSYTQIQLEKNASFYYTKIQQESAKAFHMSTVKVKQHVGSELHARSYSFGSQLARNNMCVHLQEEASCNLNGLYLVGGRQHQDHYTQISHLKPYGVSREYYKGILNGHGRAVFNGQVYVHPEAHHTDTDQVNRNLLLSDTAEIDTKPELQIYNDNVKCTHGATVGQLSEDALFYLRSRGIEEQNAKALLTYAFAREMVEVVQEKSLQDYLQKLVTEKMNLLWHI